MQHPDYDLLTIAIEPAARKAVAKETGLPSGAIPVLAAVAFHGKLHGGTRPRDIYALNLASKTLIRAYLGELAEAGMVERTTTRRTRYVRLTLEGLRIIGNYQRHLRAGRRQAERG